MSLADRLTVVVPTYNRPAQCRRLVEYLALGDDPPVVLVLDSSDEAFGGSAYPLPVEVRIYHSATTPFDKFRDGIRHVATPYAMFCADDDFVIRRRLTDLVKVLDSGPAVAVHGRYFGFESKPDLVVRRVLDSGFSQIDARPLARLCRFLTAYEAITYAMCRTEVLRDALDQACAFSSLLFRELMSGAFVVAQGPVRRLDMFTHGRDVGFSHSYRGWHPLEYAFESPAAFLSEAGRATALLTALAGEGADASRAIALSFLAYTSSTIATDALIRATRHAASGDSRDRALPTLWAYQYPSGTPWLDGIRATSSWHRARHTPLVGYARRALASWNRRRGVQRAQRAWNKRLQPEFIVAAGLSDDDLARLSIDIDRYLGEATSAAI